MIEENDIEQHNNSTQDDQKEEKIVIDDTEEKEERKLDVPNDINVIIKSKEDGILFDQDCCTCYNLILNNEGKIATSFLGVHNETILKQIKKATKLYFKALSKNLKEERKKAKAELKEEQKNKKNKEVEKDEDKNEGRTKVIATDSPSASHECDDKGNIIKKERFCQSKSTKRRKKSK